ncbi:MAG: trehalose-phosphatase [Ferrovum sp.]|nr:trehalose-phosphatase [Ferrovum sp.]
MKRLPSPSSSWAYFLDVDGTLIELADTPDAVHVDHLLLTLIDDLHQKVGGALALISGRSLTNLDHCLKMPWLPIAGQHGLERRDNFGNIHRHGISQISSELFVERLAPLMARHPGLHIEYKGATLAVHYRREPHLGSYLHRLLKGMVLQMAGLQVQPGKRVLEIKPSGYDKGSAIEEYMSQPPFAGRRVVFIGDDLTDEHGFAVVNRLDGYSIKVGAGRTCAHYRLSGIESVRSWLAKLLLCHATMKQGDS